MRSKNFRWKEAIWLALDDCRDYPDTQSVYLSVQNYKQLSKHQRELDNKVEMPNYYHTVRDVLNFFRKVSMIAGVKEDATIKLGTYRWLGLYANKEVREEIRRNVEQGKPLEKVFRDLSDRILNCY